MQNSSMQGGSFLSRFDIYAGLSGGFGGATFQCTVECKDVEEAEWYAKSLAIEEYESYEGMHGIFSWEDCRDDLIESFGEVTDADVDAYYQDQIDNWCRWFVVPHDPYNPPSEE